jgi:putative PIN family toxin of toxin-antitoxin system
MKVVLDTNILLHIASPRSDNYWVFKSFIQEKYQLAFSTEILLEYEEIIAPRMGINYFNILYELLIFSPNTQRITPFYYWQLITIDPYDNKFVDAAIAAGADYIVTEDGHFDVLKKIPFPPVKVINLDMFKLLLEELPA